ncbi:MAG: hypothetical protein GY869_16400, partial [Planctomycetes bacterium]|nr:hypothetical protein [Planctomycetota bacterium]
MMKALRSITLAAIGALIITFLLVNATAQSAPAQQSNLLRNGDFEAGFYAFNGDSGMMVPYEWEAWWDNAKAAPHYNRSDKATRIQSGVHSASYWATHVDYDAGLRQIITDATPNTIYRFQAYGQAWSTTDQSVETSNTDVFMRIGIDPNGGTNPFEPAVVWSSGNN